MFRKIESCRLFCRDTLRISHYIRRVPPLLPRLLLAAFVASVSMAKADEVPFAAALGRGDYAQIIAQAKGDDPRATEAKLRALLALGRYAEANDLATVAARRFRADAALQFAVYEAFHAVGRGPEATDALMVAARSAPGDYDPEIETPAAAAARARALQLLGADPKLVLERILTNATKTSPDAREPYLALAEIALNKHDYLLASETLRTAALHFPNDADIEFALARSFEAPAPSNAHLEKALQANPRLAPAWVFKAGQLTDLQDYNGAGKALDAALAINPADPAAWAQRALLARLRGDNPAAVAAYDKALEPWPENPEVDRIIGTGLANHYRFAEAITTLRAGLEKDPNNLPLHFELGSNLLRYGDEKEGWTHIRHVHERDPYHVAAFNLVTLGDTMAKMQTLRGGGVALRLSAADAAIFGPQALALCERARRTLAEKYGVTLPFDVKVDLLPTQQDFAVRTFTLPGGEGFLGVCFGPLITACSPRGRLGRANWESVLWHEMAHTITLTGTRHRIPRWLSEGLSVHEENIANPGWGMAMNSERRKAILEGKFLPIADLDAAFRKDIDLAYFQSSLVTAFLVERFGPDGIKRLLAELKEDRSINDALAAVAGDPKKMEADFAAYARSQAKNYGPALDWKPLSLEEYQSLQADPDAFLRAQPRRYFAVMQRARDLAKAEQWTEITALLEPLVALEPANREPDSPYQLLAAAARARNDAAAERTALETRVRLDAGDLASAERLLELAEIAKNDNAIATTAAQVLAINPAHPDALLALGRRAVREGNLTAAIARYEALLSMAPIEGGRLRFELARALQARGDTRARRQILLTLDANPRFAPALQLLRAMHGKSGEARP